MVLRLALVAHDENVGLLQIAFRRRRQGAGAQQPQQIRRHLARLIAPLYAMGGDAGEFVQPGQAGVDFEPFSETFEKRGLYGLGGVRHRTAP